MRLKLTVRALYIGVRPLRRASRAARSLSATRYAAAHMNRTCRFPVLAALVALSLGTTPGWGQRRLFSQPIDSGVLVRLTLPSHQLVRGRLLVTLQPASDTVTYCRYPGNPCSDGGSVGVRRTLLPEVMQVEVARGSRWLSTGILVGVGGFVGGYALGKGFGGLCESSCPNPWRVGLGVGVAGAVLGVLAGSADPVWRRAP